MGLRERLSNITAADGTCGHPVGRGYVTYPCRLERGHPEDEPHVAIEIEFSVRQHNAWEAAQTSAQVSAETRQEAPAAPEEVIIQPEAPEAAQEAPSPSGEDDGVTPWKQMMAWTDIERALADVTDSLERRGLLRLAEQARELSLSVAEMKDYTRRLIE